MPNCSKRVTELLPFAVQIGVSHTIKNVHSWGLAVSLSSQVQDLDVASADDLSLGPNQTLLRPGRRRERRRRRSWRGFSRPTSRGYLPGSPERPCLVPSQASHGFLCGNSPREPAKQHQFSTSSFLKSGHALNTKHQPILARLLQAYFARVPPRSSRLSQLP